MALMMDSLSGNDPLKTDRTAALCFTQQRLPLHNLNAGTSRLLNGPDIRVFESEYERQYMTPSTSTFSSFSSLPELTANQNNSRSHIFGDTSAAPGPTSCVFLEKELKQLYAKEDFDVLESLGEGFFGDVFKVRHRVTGEVMVLKIGKDREKENRIRVKANILKEVAVLNQLTHHPNILAFRGVCVDIDPNEGLWDLHILVDYCDGGSLNRLICNTQKVFPWQLRCSLARDIACAMYYVHSKNIMHRDLTSMNVLLQTASTGTKAVVADFGLSCRVPHHGECLVQVGTPYWMAPECLKEEFYDQNADVFSFGIIMCQMIARIDADPEVGMYRTDNFGLDYVRFLAHCPMDTPLEFLKLAFQCVVMDPTKRPSFVQVHERLQTFIDNKDREGSIFRTESSSDSRIGRSLSDAALKSPQSFRRLPENFYHVDDNREESSENISNPEIRRPAILIEGIPLSKFESADLTEVCANKTKMEELARSVAVTEVRPGEENSESGNPFIRHEVYSTTRKLALPEGLAVQKKVGLKNSRQRSRKCPRGDEGENFEPFGLRDSFYDKKQNDGQCEKSIHVESTLTVQKKSEQPKKIRRRYRRSISMPCTLSSTSKMFAVNEDVTDPSFSSAYQATPPSSLYFVDGIQCALQGKMTMNFKHEDQKFTSRRYPSRRHTVMDGNLVSKENALPIMSTFTADNLMHMSDRSTASEGDKPSISRISEDRSNHNEDFDVVLLQPLPVCLSSGVPSEESLNSMPYIEAEPSPNATSKVKCDGIQEYDWVVPEPVFKGVAEQTDVSLCGKQTGMSKLSGSIYDGSLLCVSGAEMKRTGQQNVRRLKRITDSCVLL